MKHRHYHKLTKCKQCGVKPVVETFRTASTYYSTAVEIGFARCPVCRMEVTMMNTITVKPQHPDLSRKNTIAYWNQINNEVKPQDVSGYIDNFKLLGKEEGKLFKPVVIVKDEDEQYHCLIGE